MSKSRSYGQSKNGPIAIIDIAAELPSGEHSSNGLDHNWLRVFPSLLNRGESYVADRFSAEAGVVIVLKPLDRAIADNDHIYATILGTGFNDLAPINASPAKAQRTQSGRNPSECDYVEVHATGAPAGEVNWLGDEPNHTGYADINGFLASLTKVLGMIKTGLISPHPNLNLTIDYDRHHLRDIVPLPIFPDSQQALISFASSSTGAEGSHGKTMLDVVTALLDVFVKEFSPDVPFTTNGIDSAKMSCFLRLFVVDMTFHDLARRLGDRNVSRHIETYPTAGVSPSGKGAIDEMEAMITKYSKDFFEPTVNTPSSARSKDSETVVLTGTTGALGTAILAHLVEMPSVTRIYAINRPDSQGSMSLEERQAASLRQRGYDAAILKSSKVVLVEARLDIPGFGIPREMFDEIKASVTTIIHSAWPVNWSMPLTLFENSIKGLRNLIDLSLSSAFPARLLFVSSMGIFLQQPTSPAPSPEQPVTSFHSASRMGYKESKFVAERILAKAATVTKLRPIIVRPGQIAGAPNGAWNHTEWLPRIVRSAPHLGCLPGEDQEISWISLNIAAKAVIEMRKSPFPILHLVNPHPVPWSVIVEPMAKKLSVPIVPYTEWLNRLEVQNKTRSVNDAVENNGHIPALPLVDIFLRAATIHSPGREAFGLPRMDVQQAVKVSPSLRNAKRLSSDDALGWLSWWRPEMPNREARL